MWDKKPGDAVVLFVGLVVLWWRSDVAFGWFILLMGIGWAVNVVASSARRPRRTE
jgi:hypothetical protein